METLIFILLAYSISNIIVYGSIFEGFREFWNTHNPNFFGKLFSCMMCTPFWVGFILSLTFNLCGQSNLSPTTNLGVDVLLLSLFLDSCLSSGMVWLIHTLQEMMERSFQE